MWNLLYSIFTILCLTIYINGADIPPIPNSVRLLSSQNKLCSKYDDIWKCQDCHNVKKCNGDNNEYSFKCGDQFPGRPYCNPAAKDITDMCVSDETVCVPDPVQCSRDGMFPSLTNCKAYHLCLSKDAASFPYLCTGDTIYNHALMSCKLNSPCFTVKDECGIQNKIIPYRLDESLYVICHSYEQPLLKFCAKGLIFNSTTVTCEFKCPGEGAFANPLDRSSYYMCYVTGDVLLKKLNHCPCGSEFDDAKKSCSWIDIITRTPTTPTTTITTTTSTPINTADKYSY